MVSQIPEKKETMPFQIPSKKVLIFVQTSLQLVPNQPRNTSTMPWMMPTAAERTPLIPSHTPEKIVWMPVHICDQFPVNSPINTSKMPVITFSTVESTTAIA